MAGLYVVDVGKTTPLLLNTMVCPLTMYVVSLAFRPMLNVVPDTTASVASTVTTTPSCVIVEAFSVAAWTAEYDMLSGLLRLRVVDPPTIALGPTVNVSPLMVTNAVELPVGSATFEPPMKTDEDPTWTGTPLTSVTVAEAAPNDVATPT